MPAAASLLHVAGSLCPTRLGLKDGARAHLPLANHCVRERLARWLDPIAALASCSGGGGDARHPD